MEEINLSQLVIYQQEEQQRKNKVKRKVNFLTLVPGSSDPEF